MESKTKTIIACSIGGAGGTIAAVLIIMSVMQVNNEIRNAWQDPTVSDASSRILAGDYDAALIDYCSKRLSSYGIYSSDELQGATNMCVDTAKAIAYNELNK